MFKLKGKKIMTLFMLKNFACKSRSMTCFFKNFSGKTHVVGTQKQSSFEHPKPMFRLMGKSVLCIGQDFWGTPVSPYLTFRGTFTYSGGHTKSLKFLLVN